MVDQLVNEPSRAPQVLEYLGAKIDTQVVTVSLPGTKIPIILRTMAAAQRANQLPVAKWLHLLGIMTLTIPMARWVQWDSAFSIRVSGPVVVGRT